MIKCPTEGCNSKIRIGEERFVGGVNDKGGLVIQCSSCEILIPVRVKNPLDATNVISGGEVIDKWYEEIQNENDILKKHNIPPERVALVERLLAIDFDDTIELPEFRTIDIPAFADSNFNYEVLAYQKLEEHNDEIVQYYDTYKNGFYLQGKETCMWSTIFIDYEVAGKSQKACFAKTIRNEKDLNPDNLYLIGHSNVDFKYRINGIYSKTNCLNFLERVLNRWRYVADEVLIVVPFIGYSFSDKSLPEVKELWEWLQQNMDVDKTKLVTRKGTYNLLKRAQSKTGIDYNLLVEWGLLEPLFDSMEKGEMPFFERSHAKYYVGVFKDKVEVLSGSFNIHKGPSFENVTFETYSKEFFLERYLHMFKEFEYASSSIEFPVHTIEIQNDKSINYVKYESDFFNLWNQI